MGDVTRRAYPARVCPGSSPPSKAFCESKPLRQLRSELTSEIVTAVQRDAPREELQRFAHALHLVDARLEARSALQDQRAMNRARVFAEKRVYGSAR